MGQFVEAVARDYPLFPNYISSSESAIALNL